LQFMTLKELKELIDIFTSRESIEELEIEKSGVRLKVRRQPRHVDTTHAPQAIGRPAPTATSLEAPLHAPVPAQKDDLFYVKAPIVGTFYKSPNPNSPPFINVGDFVEKGTVICIVEAMKLMNEIEAEVAGQVTAAFVENGQPVEFGEKLFAIKRS
jgi:acetyl-CoA carboxylase biotin carboxyl carrier protein